MLAELHCHSIYSTSDKIAVEGLNRPREIIEHAKKMRIGCIALTDHDTMRGINEAKKYAKKYGIILIPGEEITTENGHVIGLGIQEKIKPKLSVIETIEVIKKQGGISIAPHPFDFRRKGIRYEARMCNVIEVFNALNVDRSANNRAKKFALKNRKPAVAGSDAHCIEMLGYGTTVLPHSSNEDGCIKAIRNNKTKIIGRYIPINIMAWWTIQRLKYSYYYTINYMNINYRWPKRFIGTNLIKLVNKSPGKIDYAFKLMAYLGLGCVISYSFLRNVVFNFFAEKSFDR